MDKDMDDMDDMIDHEGYNHHESCKPIPVITDPANPWLPKTDWSRDGIIASDD